MCSLSTSSGQVESLASTIRVSMMGPERCRSNSGSLATIQKNGGAKASSVDARLPKALSRF